MRISDWSSDVCSSDLSEGVQQRAGAIEPLYEWFSGLSFDDSVCWAFGVVEGDLEELYWTLSYWELSQKIQLRYGELSSLQLCTYAGFAEIVSAALGGGKKAEVQKIGGTGSLEGDELGRASCRERVCQYVLISGVGVSLKKKN